MRHLQDSAAGGAALTPTTTPHHEAHDPADYRKALGCFGTGVTVVTAHHDGLDWGMTCNSFNSVSLSPRMVLWSIRKEASSHAAFTASGGFTASVLAASQQALARQFALGSLEERFAGVPVQRMASGRLRLDGVAAWFDCRLRQVVDGGDHHILLGEVQDYGWSDVPALGYYRSQFVNFAPR